MIQTVENWGDAVRLSVTQALSNFLGFLPALIGAIIVLLVGWILSGFLATLIERALKTVGFERASQSSGIAGFIEKSGSNWTASKVVAEIVKWFIRLVAIQAAASILGMGRISQIIDAMLLFLPNVIVALAIVVLGAFIAKFVAGLVRGTVTEMGFDNPDLVANVARYAIIVFAVIAAVDQLGIAETVVNTLLVGTVAALALAFGLAFGFGGQATAAQLTQSWYLKGREASQKVAEYAERSQADSGATSATTSTARATEG
jgi:small-conductance mechanosensitive channel